MSGLVGKRVGSRTVEREGGGGREVVTGPPVKLV